MKQKETNRLFFIDAMRAWAIIMMLEGHFIDGLLHDAFRVDGMFSYDIWKYFRGITAPAFFTVSGFIFTYLLIRKPQWEYRSKRIRKGIKRGLELLVIGYLLQTNFLGLLHGEIYSYFYVVNVLHCIGLSLILISGVFLLLKHWEALSLMPILFLSIGVVLFVFEPWYEHFNFSGLPILLENYFSKANGSVFTIFPWFGYTCIGAFLSIVFHRFRFVKEFYGIAIPLFLLLGMGLMFYSTPMFKWLAYSSGWELFGMVANNNYLFIRLGDVFLVFAVFILLRKWMQHPTLLKIGSSTLTIYIVHFILLYGSFTGLGIYKYLYHSLYPWEVILGAILFVSITIWLSLKYEKYKLLIHAKIKEKRIFVFRQLKYLYLQIQREWYLFRRQLVVKKIKQNKF
ncbi:MAG: DUF1624 domain-containing protein [Flavobacteriaceae bacterium]|nr:DUF1624 domain-containing protein [Flavobacteriaceae bacterium]